MTALHEAGRLAFHGEQAGLVDRDAFSAHLAPLRKAEWVVYAKRPFGEPEAGLAYLSRDTHRVAISNSRLASHDERDPRGLARPSSGSTRHDDRSRPHRDLRPDPPGRGDPPPTRSCAHAGLRRSKPAQGLLSNSR